MNSSGEALQDIFLLLGDQILEVHTLFGSHGENGWLETVLTYITLEQNGVIHFPFSGERKFCSIPLNPQAKKIEPLFREQIINQTVKDLYFVIDENGEPDWEWMAFIELNNGRVFHENRMSPHGTGHADFFVYTREQFEAKIIDLSLTLISLTSLSKRDSV